MLSEEKIEENRKRYTELIESISSEKGNIEGFLNWASKSDFFFAPASSKYHCNYPGGLCEHSLNVYDTLLKLVDKFESHYEYHEKERIVNEDGTESVSAEEVLVRNFSEDTLKVVALLHDISKTNFYEQFMRNVKDENGNWTQVQEYKTRDASDRFIFGSHEQNSEFIARTFFNLTVEESTAILHHHAGKSWDSAQDDVSAVFTRYSLAVLLHMADMLSTFLIEKEDE